MGELVLVPRAERSEALSVYLLHLYRGECVRGCRDRCGCPECVANGQPLHRPRPRWSTDGLLCRQCAVKLWDRLHSIPELFGSLDRELTDSGMSEGRSGKISGSPALVRLDVLAMQDPRTNYDPKDPQGLRYIPAVIAGWERYFGEQSGLTNVPGMLTLWWPVLLMIPWILGPMFDELAEVDALLRSAHGEVRPRPVGRCSAQFHLPVGFFGPPSLCGANLYSPATNADRIRCSRCGYTYGRLEQLRLAHSQKGSAA